MIDNYLNYIQESDNKPKILYHASDILKTIIEPRKSSIGHTKKMKNNYPTKDWEKTAVFAGTTPAMCFPFGLERLNILWPGNHTEEEVASWDHGCYLSASAGGGKLIMCYYNCKPEKPTYLYTVDSKNFTKVNDKLGAIVEQWICTKKVKPLKTKKYMPNQIKQYWKIIGKKDWEIKKAKYKLKGYYK
jgi:hypothetical protein